MSVISVTICYEESFEIKKKCQIFNEWLQVCKWQSLSVSNVILWYHNWEKSCEDSWVYEFCCESTILLRLYHITIYQLKFHHFNITPLHHIVISPFHHVFFVPFNHLTMNIGVYHWINFDYFIIKHL